MTVCYNNCFVFISDITSILKETPSKYELFSLLHSISDKWYDIGLSLQVRRSVLDDLKHDQRDNDYKLFAVIQNFLTSRSSTINWETVIAAIESPTLNDMETADLIYQYLNTGKSNKLLLLSNIHFKVV